MTIIRCDASILLSLCLLFLSATISRAYSADGVSCLGSINDYTLSDNATVTFNCDNGTLIIQQYAGCGWKVSSLPTGKTLADERKSVTLTGEYRGRIGMTVTDNDIYVTIRTALSGVNINKSTSTVSFTDKRGVIILSEDNGIDNTSATKTVSFKPQGENGFYGGGYNGRWSNLDGHTLIMNNTQNYNWDQSDQTPNNICVPFIVSTNGYGVLFEDHYIDASITPSSTDGIRYTSASPDPISYVFVGSADGSIAGVMETYSELTGRHELPPYWSLGYITSRYGYHTQEETENVIKSFQKENIPVSGVVLDLYWQGEKENGMGNLDWYKPNWPDAAGMMSDFGKQGIHTIIITEPYFAEETQNYTTLLQKKLFADPECPGMEWVSSKKVGIIDFMNPAAVDWMWDFYRQRTDEGVDGWWLDLGEPEMITEGTIHYNGDTHPQAHNEFGMTWIAGVWKKWKQYYPDQRPVFLPRSGTSGMQRYATFPWTGDIARSWSGLKCQIPAFINGGMSGLGYLHSDAGGFVTENREKTIKNIVNPELYLRWIQLGVFSPVLRTHSQYLPEPYHDIYSDYKGRIRELINLRYRMLPYIYSAAWRNSTSGIPITVPLDFYTAESRNVADVDDEYLFGPNILVAPVTEPDAIGRDVTLPSGEWIDPVSSTLYDGGTTISFSSADMRLPYFYRRGTFTPLYSQTTFRNTDDIDRSAIEIYYPMSRDNAWEYTMYDDDHTSALIGDKFETITFNAVEQTGQHRITVTQKCGTTYTDRPTGRKLTFVIPLCTNDVKDVSSNTLSITDTDYDSDTSTLTFKAELPSATGEMSHSIIIKYNQPSGIEDITATNATGKARKALRNNAILLEYDNTVVFVSGIKAPSFPNRH